MEQKQETEERGAGEGNGKSGKRRNRSIAKCWRRGEDTEETAVQ